MASSILMRVSNESAERVKTRAEKNSRTQVAEMDLIIEAGIGALEAKERRKAASTGS